MSVVSRTQPGDRGGSCVVTHAATCCRVRRHATPCDGVRRCTSSPPILPPPRCCDLAPSSCFVFLFGLRSSSSRSSSFFSNRRLLSPPHGPAQGNPPPPATGPTQPCCGGCGRCRRGRSRGWRPSALQPPRWPSRCQWRPGRPSGSRRRCCRNAFCVRLVPQGRRRHAPR